MEFIIFIFGFFLGMGVGIVTGLHEKTFKK